MAKKKVGSDDLFRSPGGPAQLYLFVEIASFTENWSDLKLGDDELRALWKMRLHATRCERLSSRVAGGVRKVRRTNAG